MPIARVPVVYFDESGFTGADLLNAEQTVFAIASVSLNNDEAKSLLANILGPLNKGSEEYSHSVLAKTPEGQRRIVALVTELAKSPEPVARFYMIQKRFALLAKLLDNWVEPTMYANGLDLTRDGGMLSYTNMTWFCLPTFEGSDRFETLLRAYQDFSREPTPNGFERFFYAVRTLYQTSTNEQGRDMLGQILVARSLGVEQLRRLGAGAHDLAYPTVFATIAHWDSIFDSTFAVVHDASKNLRPVHHLLEAVMRVGEGGARQRVGFDATNIYTLPFRCASLRFEDSKLHSQLQIADILAGAAMTVGRYLLNRSHKAEYAKALIESGAMDTLRFGWMWPLMEDIKRRQSVGPGVGDPLAVSGQLLTCIEPNP